jgi:hypothetical protein
MEDGIALDAKLSSDTEREQFAAVDHSPDGCLRDSKRRAHFVQGKQGWN